MMLVVLVVVVAVLTVSVQSLNFLAVGDWGGTETAPYYTPGQLASVTGMEKVAKALKSEFVLAVGEFATHCRFSDR
jgi:tartrate-resistant acid phosphatase type 5